LWLRPWVVFGGGALAVVLLDWGEPVLMPVAVSLLLTFLLNPPVNSLQRWIGRAPAVVIVVSLTFLMLTALGWVLARQVTSLAADLPGYRQNIRQKVADVRALSRGGPVAQVQSTLEDIKQEIAKGEQEIAKGEAAKRPSSVVVAEPDSLLPIPTWVSSLFEPLGTAGLVVVLVVFMLLEQRDMRDRIVALMGDGHVARATKAVDEAGARLSQYLLMQTLINVIYGVMVGASLWFFGVPYPVLWAVVAAVLRFIPYVGPWIAAGAPIIVSLAALPGWTTPLYVAGTFLVLELITNMVLETVFYAGAAGVTQVALLISIAFWTWIWGPLGLLLATPLTVCLAVLGKYVPSLRGLSMLISDQPMLSPDAAFYQRVLANQIDDAREIVDRQADAQSAECAFDALLVPALSYAERDRAANRLSLEEERRVIETTRELAGGLEARLAPVEPAPGESSEAGGDASADAAFAPVAVLSYPVDSRADEAALEMLQALVRDLPVAMEITSVALLVSELVTKVRQSGFGVVVLSDLPPSNPAKLRYAIKRLRTACPDVKILVGRWAPGVLADENSSELLEAGATYVGSTLIESRNQLREIVGHLVGLTAPPTRAAS